jgi:hypothetical protein
MSNKIWPSLHGLGWKVDKSITFSNATQKGLAPGYETRLSYGPDPIFEFELQYVVLYAAARGTTLKQLEKFYKDRRGGYESFLLDFGAVTKDPTESSITDTPLTVDINGCAPLIRTDSAGYEETIYELAVDDSGNVIYPTVKQGVTTLTRNVDYVVYSAAQTASGVLNANGLSYAGVVIQMIASPEITSDVTASFSWMYRVRFMGSADGASGSQSASDAQTFEMFHYLLWNCQSVQLIGCRT